MITLVTSLRRPDVNIVTRARMLTDAKSGERSSGAASVENPEGSSGYSSIVTAALALSIRSRRSYIVSAFSAGIAVPLASLVFSLIGWAEFRVAITLHIGNIATSIQEEKLWITFSLVLISEH